GLLIAPLTRVQHYSDAARKVRRNVHGPASLTLPPRKFAVEALWNELSALRGGVDAIFLPILSASRSRRQGLPGHWAGFRGSVEIRLQSRTPVEHAQLEPPQRVYLPVPRAQYRQSQTGCLSP